MKRLALIAVCSFAASVFSIGCGPDPRAAGIAALTGDPAAGRTIYESTAMPTCASCHQTDGSGSGPYPSLHNAAAHSATESLATTIVQGRGQMPAFGPQLNDQQIADVIAYLRMAFGS